MILIEYGTAILRTLSNSVGPPLAYSGGLLIGLSVLVTLLAGVLSLAERWRVTVRMWLALAWLATLLLPVVVTLVCDVAYMMVRSASNGTYQLAPEQEMLAQVVIPLVTLALVMVSAAWLAGRLVLRPLAQMRAAARQIAEGDLEVTLPRPQIYEVAEVAKAFDAMSTALRTSIEGQAESEQQRRLFINAVAHDLRSPLFSLRGHLQGLERGIADTPEAVQRYIEICQRQAGALDRLVADLFAYTRMEYLEESVVREPVELGALLCQSVEYVRPQAEAKAITLRTQPTPEVFSLEGDGQLLARAIANLLDNALRYTPSGGSIRVRWEAASNGCRFAVEDSGPGFAPQDLPHVFDPLYRGDASRNRATGGAGLGLAIARRIFRAHSGDLTAANGPNGGAVVSGTIRCEVSQVSQVSQMSQVGAPARQAG